MMSQRRLFNIVIITTVNFSMSFFAYGTSSRDKARIHPALREQMLCEKYQDRSLSYKTAGKKESIDVFIETDNPSALKIIGLYLRSRLGQIYTTSITADQIQAVARMEGVRNIEPAIHCTPQLDVSMPEIGLTAVWDGVMGEPLRGENVIIGLYDSGIDWKHADFIKPDGTTRLLCLWDQTDSSGKEPDSYAYGSEYSQTDINDEIDGSPAGLVHGVDSLGHGTHVAGIAAGNGRASQSGQRYQGAAPEADLIVVKGGNTNFNSSYIIDGLTYIFEKAGDLFPSRPVVVNLSVGGIHTGPHDGSSLFEKSLDNLLNESGRAVVVAAGNDGNSDIHFKGDMANIESGNDYSVGFNIGSNAPDEIDNVFFDIWYTSSADLSVMIQTPSGLSIGPVNRGDILRWPSSSSALVHVDNASDGVYSNGDCEIYIQISDVLSDEAIESFDTGEWHLIFSGNAGRFDGWLYESSMNAVLTSNVDRTTLLREPANARRCIAVGSYITRLEWPSHDNSIKSVSSTGRLSEFTSSGPPRPNSNGSSPAQKPEITAPGEYILSSYSSSTVLNIPDDSYLTGNGYYRAMRGTSMAAPHVTGVVALMLQRDPEMSVSDIRRWLIETARKDDFTGSDVWDERWGYGKLNGSGAVYQTAVPEYDPKISKSLILEQNYPNPFNNETSIDFSASPDEEPPVLTIYDIEGRLVQCFDMKQSENKNTVCWDGKDSNGKTVATGLYVYQLVSGSEILSRKMLYIQ